MGRPLRRQFWPPVRLLWALGLVLVLGGLGLGCGRGSYIGRQYDDFTAYYNTYHNATEAFEKGLKSVNQSGSDVDRSRYLSVFPTPLAGPGGPSFEKAIQKSADVLRKHPNSKWVDDALLLIGRARYYKQNYAGAVNKFQEVIALEGEREGEARFRLARTLMAADRYSEAAEALRAGLEQEKDYGTWTARMRLVRGELFVQQEKWREAEQALSRGLKGSLPEDTGARAAFLLAQVRETLDDFEGAQAAYRRVLKYDSTYRLRFAARLGAIEMQGLSGDPEAALTRLESLEREDNTNEMRGKIARVRARLYQEQGRPDKAKQVLTDVLRSENAPTGTVQGRVHYDLATLYRDTYEDFTQAAAHFDTAATTLSSGPRRRRSGAGQRAPLLPGAPSDASAQAERFRSLADHSQAVARMDSLLHLAQMPPAQFQSVVERLRKQRLKKLEEETQRRRRQQFRGGGQGGAQRGRSSRSQQSAVQTRGSDAGFLFHRNPTLVQQGRRQFKQTWGDRPLVDNWRRVNAIRERSASTVAEEGAAREPEQSGPQGSSERLVDLSAVPRDSGSQAEMEKKRAVARYELANALFRAAGRPDSAETWFRHILEEDEDYSVARKALYGLAQAHRAQGDTAAAQNAYRRLIEEHPGTPYAKRAREQLGLERADPVSSSEAGKADSAYAQAYETWQNGALDAALGKFLTVAETYPETSTAPRALLAAGVVYHRSTQRDTSGHLRSRFQQYVDSLAQSSAGTPSGPGANADTTGGGKQTTPPRERPPSDTADVQDPPDRAADTTAGPGPPEQALPQPERRSGTADVASDPSRRADPELSSREAKLLRRRAVDSTEATDRDRPRRRPDSARAESPASTPDTTARTGQETRVDRAGSAQGASSDSIQAKPDSVGANPDSAQANPDSVRANPDSAGQPRLGPGKP